MDYLRFLSMKVVERIEKLIRPGQDLTSRKRTTLLRHHRLEIVTGDVLHYEKLALALRKMIAYSWQRWMMHTS